MKCASCQQDNPEGARFCNNCGAPLAIGAQGLAPPQPTAFADGRYRVERKLGEGGKGIVFLCQDTVLGRKVAVKLIKDQEMDQDALARFQREVQAMAALVHPNVVTIFDIGQHPSAGSGQGGQYYLVLELMEGGDVAGLIQKAPGGKLDAPTAIRITAEAARGLAHAHTHGILHRDIKPGNIWLTKEGFAKLGDFGLAYLSQGAKLTRAGMMVGTVAYMAPELALGRGADARSDLYMLGASLYEMLAGRLPFPGDDPVRVIFSHINDLPPAPRRFASDIPESLERLVMRLLAKDPEQRPGTAQAVMEALANLGVGAGSHLTPGPFPMREGEQTPPSFPGKGAGGLGSSTPSPSPAYARPLVGRERERDALRARLDAAMQGQGGLVFLTGEAGIGKTRLAAELRAYARQRGCLWLEGRYDKDAGVSGQPYQEAIRQYLRMAPRGAIAQHVGQYAAELSRSYPDIAAALGTAPPPVDSALLQEDPQGARQRQLDAFCHLFSSFASEKPLVLFLDDLQWSPSMDYLQALAQRAQTEPLLLIGAYREQELKDSQALSRTVLAMNRLRLFQAMPLHRLERPGVAEMVRGALGQPPSEALVDLVNGRTQGNPFFVEELVRHLVETGALTQSERGWDVKDTPGLQMPDSVKVLVEEKLERLSEGTRTMLATASVIGGEFDLPLLQEVTGLDDDALAGAMEEALDARILTPKTSVGREAYAFADNQIREALYEGISAFRRRRFHLRVGQAIEKVHARRLEEHYGALANHFIQGNDTEKAVDYSIKAGDAAYNRATFPRAMEHYRVAAELLDELGEETERAAHVHERLGSNLTIAYQIGTISGASQRDLADLRRAIALYQTAGQPTRAAYLTRQMAAHHINGTGVSVNVGQALELYQSAVDLVSGLPDSPEKAIAYEGLAFGQTSTTQVALGIATGRQAVRIAEATKDADALTASQTDLAWALAQGGLLKEALTYAEMAWETSRRARSVFFRSRAAMYPWGIYPWLADAGYYRRWMERHVQLRQETRSPRHQVYEYTVGAALAVATGEGGKARELLAQAGSLRQRAWSFNWPFESFAMALLGDWEAPQGLVIHLPSEDAQRHQQMAWLTDRFWLGATKLWSGDANAALAQMRQSLETAQTCGAVTYELTYLPLVASAHARLGQLDEAQKALARAQEILASAEEWLGLPAAVYHAEGVLAAAQGRYDQAESAFRRAADTSLSHGMVYDQAQALYDWAVMYLDRAALSSPSPLTGVWTGEGGGETLALTVPPPATPPTPAEALALRNRGQDLLDQALAIFRRCDAKKDIEKCLARKERLTA